MKKSIAAIITASTLMVSISANAIDVPITLSQREKMFRVGLVKKRFATEFCGSLFAVPNNNQKVILNIDRDDGRFSWININGKDVRIRRLSDQVTKHRNKIVKERMKYQGKDISIVVESTQIKNISGGEHGLDYRTSRDRITITYRGESQTIMAEGICA
jgi:hypothetical protein